MSQSSVDMVSTMPLSTAEAERLRARLNHDLLKNRMILGLYGLGSMIRGEVISPASIAEAIDAITEDWRCAKLDASEFRDFLKRGYWLSDAMNLPFVRSLSPAEKDMVQEMLIHSPGALNLSESGESIDRDVAAADAAVAQLHSIGSLDSTAAIDMVELALTAVRKFSERLGGLRLSV